MNTHTAPLSGGDPTPVDTSADSLSAGVGWSARATVAVLAVLSGAVAILVGGLATRASAQDVARFACDGTPYIMQNNDLYAVQPDAANPGGYVFEAVNTSTNFGNSLAFDPVENLLYGVRASRWVDTYDANGDVVATVELQAPWPGGSSYAGTTLGDGRYLIASYRALYAGSEDNLWEVDPTTGAVTHIGNLATRHADISFNPADGFLYHSTNQRLWKIDPRDASQVEVPMAAGMPAGHGSSWFDPAGNLFVYRNTSGVLYKISGIGSAEVTWSTVGQGQSVRGADGASCVGGFDLELGVVDSAGNDLAQAERVIEPGDRAQYRFTLFNNATPTGPRNLTICADLPADGRTLDGAVWDSSGTGSFVSGGQPGDTSFCYALQAGSSLFTDPDTPGVAPVIVDIGVDLPVEMAPGIHYWQGDLFADGDLATSVAVSDDPDSGTEADPTMINVPDTTVYAVEDAGLGEGDTCPASPDVDRPAPVQMSDIPTYGEETVIHSNAFDGSTGGWEFLTGDWRMENGALVQVNTCGYDYTALYTATPVSDFRVYTTFASVTGVNQGGVVFNQTSRDTRSGATLVDLSEDGTYVRWGTYDDTGHYVFQGGAGVAPVAEGASVELSIESNGETATIYWNGLEVGTVTNRNQGGYVGLVTSLSTVAFDQFDLVGLPDTSAEAPTSTTVPPSSTVPPSTPPSSTVPPSTVPPSTTTPTSTVPPAEG